MSDPVNKIIQFSLFDRQGSYFFLAFILDETGTNKIFPENE